MSTDNRKIVLIGTGMVGMSYAYALLNQNACDELVLIDINKERAMGEAMDLNHGLAFSSSHMKIYAGDYSDCETADIVVICAGVAQKEGESRLDLLQRNVEVFRSIINPVTESGFNGIFLVATNPVDIMTHVTCTLSGFNPRRVFGSGTALDTARLRYMVGDYFSVDPRNIHAYVIGEHGDSELAAWSSATATANLYPGHKHCWPQNPLLKLSNNPMENINWKILNRLSRKSAEPHNVSLKQNGQPITESAWHWFGLPKRF